MKIKSVAFTLSLLFVSTLMSAQSMDKNSLYYIETMGYAKEEFLPDEIYVSIELLAKDTKNGGVDAQQAQLISALKTLKIDVEKQLLVQDMLGNTHKIWTGKKEVAQTRTYELKLTNTADIQPLFAALENLKVNSFSISKLQLSDIEQKMQLCKVKAIENAKTQAKALSAAIGQTIGKAIYIQDVNYNRPRMYNFNREVLGARMMKNDAESSQPVLDFNKITTEANITVRFILE